MTDIYIGIDPGSKNCALVAWSPSRGLVTAWKPKPPMPTGVLRLRKLMVDITNEFTKLAAHEPAGEVKMIAMEAYSMAEKFGQHASGEVGAAIKLAVLSLFASDDRRGFPILVAPQALKKFATGNGNTKKELITKEILKRWGMDFDDSNIAEAYALARIAHAVDARPDGLTQFQKDVVAALDGRTEWIPIPQRRLVRVGR
jgi:Holliday junction resolvasome RuvABC endonuclease subunit